MNLVSLESLLSLLSYNAKIPILSKVDKILLYWVTYSARHTLYALILGSLFARLRKHTCYTRSDKHLPLEYVCSSPSEHSLMIIVTCTLHPKWNIGVGQEKPHTHHLPLNMYYSKLDIRFHQRFCFTHIQGPVIIVVGQEKPHTHHLPLNMCYSKLDIGFHQRFCFTHIQGPVIIAVGQERNNSIYHLPLNICNSKLDMSLFCFTQANQGAIIIHMEFLLPTTACCYSWSVTETNIDSEYSWRFFIPLCSNCIN